MDYFVFRCVYSKHSIPREKLIMLQDLIDSVPYFCGAVFPPEDHKLVEVCLLFNVWIYVLQLTILVLVF